MSVTVADPLTLLDALAQLATPEPDYADDPGGWQTWRDRTTAALKLAATLQPVSELAPAFTVQVVLDGDDWPPTATEVVRVMLADTVAGMKAAGVIRDGNVQAAARPREEKLAFVVAQLLSGKSWAAYIAENLTLEDFARKALKA